MKYLVSLAKPANISGDCLICPVYVDGKDHSMPQPAAALNSACGGGIASLLKSGDVPDGVGSLLLCRDLPGIKSGRVLLVNCGSGKNFDRSTYRKVLQAAAGRIQQLAGIGNVINLLPQLSVPQCDAHIKTRQAVLDTEDVFYSFDAYRGDENKKARALPQSMTFVVSATAKTATKNGIKEGAAISAGIKLAKDLGNTPPNICNPVYLEKQARTLCQGNSKLTLQVLDEVQMKKLGMGSLLAVARGSRQKPRLIVMKYNGARSSKQAPVMLVGKGVTFDTGGISLKPSAGMGEMKFDMCGAASVFGVMRAAAEISLAANVVGIVPAVENMPDGDATRPGDIVVSMSGQTVEILNTDAEGRLILCDAITYGLRFKPAAVIDIATLTGACVVALGHHASGVMGNDNKLVQALLKAGASSGDRAWELPLWPEYDQQLSSTFADIANISSGRDAGTITAGCFLGRFAKSVSWAHLDIAGTAWTPGRHNRSTGRPVPLLMQYLLQR